MIANVWFKATSLDNLSPILYRGITLIQKFRSKTLIVYKKIRHEEIRHEEIRHEEGPTKWEESWCHWTHEVGGVLVSLDLRVPQRTSRLFVSIAKFCIKATSLDNIYKNSAQRRF